MRNKQQVEAPLALSYGESIRFRPVRFAQYSLGHQKVRAHDYGSLGIIPSSQVPYIKVEGRRLAGAWLQDVAVAQEFAALRGDEESYLAFADKYGLVLADRNYDPENDDDYDIMGCPHPDNIPALDKERVALRHFIRAVDDEIRAQREWPDRNADEREADLKPVKKKWHNRLLRAQVILTTEPTKRGRVQPVLRVEPSRLIDYMYLVAGLKLAAPAEHRNCEKCGQPLKSGSRSDKRFCDRPACRKAVWRASAHTQKAGGSK